MDTQSQIVKSSACDNCARQRTSACTQCLFASWNAEAIQTAFSQKDIPRHKRLDAINSAPALQGVLDTAKMQIVRAKGMDTRLNIIGRPRLGQVVVGSYNRLAQVSKSLGLM
jgi:hypothetical protein